MSVDQYFKKEILDAKLYRLMHQDGVKLNQNESPWDVPLDIKVRITEKLLKLDWNRYPLEDFVSVTNSVAKFYGVQPDQICISNGSNTLIQAIIQCVPAKAKVLILDPTFSIYEMQADLNGNKVIKVPLSEEFELLPEKTLATIKKEKPGLIFIANPNAPTGTLFDKRSLYRIIESADCPVVIDEAYYPFTEETVIDWLKDFENLIVMRTFSKALALAGIRFGAIIAQPQVANQIEKFLMTFRLSRITCLIVNEILKDPSYMKDYVSKIVKERGKLFSELQKISGIEVFPSEANFLLFRVDDATSVYENLIRDKVLIRNVSNNDSLKNCLRVAVGTVEENELFLTALKENLSHS